MATPNHFLNVPPAKGEDIADPTNAGRPHPPTYKQTHIWIAAPSFGIALTRMARPRRTPTMAEARARCRRASAWSNQTR